MAKRNEAEDLMFTRADYETLRRERRRMNELIGKLDKAEACGVECQFLRQQRESIDAQLAAIEQHFMTPPPPR